MENCSLLKYGFLNVSYELIIVLNIVYDLKSIFFIFIKMVRLKWD